MYVSRYMTFVNICKAQCRSFYLSFHLLHFPSLNTLPLIPLCHSLSHPFLPLFLSHTTLPLNSLSLSLTSLSLSLTSLSLSLLPLFPSLFMMYQGEEILLPAPSEEKKNYQIKVGLIIVNIDDKNIACSG